jgi:hypothetical protein
MTTPTPNSVQGSSGISAWKRRFFYLPPRASAGGKPLPIAAKLRLDHGALASLLMPTPTAAILAAIQNILVDHNVLEEGADGLYETCDALAGPEAESTLAALRAAPEVTVMPYNDSSAAMNAVRRAVERAGYHLREQHP